MQRLIVFICLLFLLPLMLTVQIRPEQQINDHLF